ncbi:MAG: hypothetical protein LBU36_08850 [Clostridiales bacterium]|nr:hypothetical protein [Clostridiales bacterium]
MAADKKDEWGANKSTEHQIDAVEALGVGVSKNSGTKLGAGENIRNKTIETKAPEAKPRLSLEEKAKAAAVQANQSAPERKRPAVNPGVCSYCFVYSNFTKRRQSAILKIAIFDLTRRTRSPRIERGPSYSPARNYLTFSKKLAGESAPVIGGPFL